MFKVRKKEKVSVLKVRNKVLESIRKKGKRD